MYAALGGSGIVECCVLISRIAALENPYISQFYTDITGCLAMFPLSALQNGAGLVGLSELPSACLGVLLMMMSYRPPQHICS